MDDLTWQQLETASNLANLFTVVNGKLMIDVSVLLGSDISQKSQTGVVEALFKLREVAAKAQETVNVGQLVGNRLQAFPPSTSGTAVNDVVLQAGIIYVRRSLANTGILGAKN